ASIASNPTDGTDEGQVHQTVLWTPPIPPAPAGATNLYVWGYGDGNGDALRSYQYNGSSWSSLNTWTPSGCTTPDVKIYHSYCPNGVGGGFMTLSSNGSTSGTGVL